jgi:hypothetical protein
MKGSLLLLRQDIAEQTKKKNPEDIREQLNTFEMNAFLFVTYLTMLSVARGGITDHLEGSAHGLIEVLTEHLPSGTE